ncbi:MAG: type IV toxin-antitoxin system AbiEi family antitoxin domain-containing protein [Alphaproteobacteria bacterium]|nr:type IV toxin-antitoxin system AbiEi family antitoxin domain-containing protein [Alphaproteobacteria bacterium]
MANSIKHKILEIIYLKGNNYIFSATDFNLEYNRAEIDVALSTLEKEGKIRRLTRGIYDYPKYNSLLECYVAPDLNKVAYAIANKYNWNICPNGETACNYLGLSTQMPGNYIFISNGPNKKIQIGNRILEFKHSTTRETNIRCKNALLVIQAIKSIGRNQMTEEIIYKLSSKFMPSEWKTIKISAKKVTYWIYDIICFIADEVCLNG